MYNNDDGMEIVTSRYLTVTNCTSSQNTGGSADRLGLRVGGDIFISNVTVIGNNDDGIDVYEKPSDHVKIRDAVIIVNGYSGIDLDDTINTLSFQTAGSVICDNTIGINLHRCLTFDAVGKRTVWIWIRIVM
jgi:hypothetical protein